MKYTILAFLTVGMAFSNASAQDLVFTSWGGTTQDAQSNAWLKPFSQKTGIRVIQDGPTDYGKIKAMVESGSVGWDVVDTEYEWALQAGNQGLLEPLDFSIIDKSKLDPRFVSDHAVGSFYYSFVLGWNPAKFSKTQPSTFADLFDSKKFPGKRTFYKWSAPGILEAALLADGVDPKNLYPLDLDRAFKKLESIKRDIIWWEGGAQSQQLLASGEAPIGLFWNGRLAALHADGMNIGVSWHQNITAADALVVPKGSKYKAAAMKLIAEATSARGQAEFATVTRYAPINRDSAALMDQAIRAGLPDAQTAVQVNANLDYWARNRTEIGTRWYAWQAK